MVLPCPVGGAAICGFFYVSFTAHFGHHVGSGSLGVRHSPGAPDWQPATRARWCRTHAPGSDGWSSHKEALSESVLVLPPSLAFTLYDSLEEREHLLMSSSLFGPPPLSVSSSPPGSPGSPARAGDGLDAAALKQHQVGGAVAASHAGLVTRADLIPVVAGLGAARPAGVVHGAMLTLGGCTEGRGGGVRE